MGGQEGVRGYLLQAIIATLDSLNSEDWQTVSIEPNSENDKVDIVWTDMDQEEIVYQVKSSINNFAQAEILSWILELVNDSKHAKEFKLVLIGNCSSKTKSFFNNFSKEASKNSLKSNFHSLIPFKEKIHVEIRPFDSDTLEEAINSKVHKFLSKKNLTLDFSTVELIADGLKLQFLRFSTNGRKMSREDFVSKLLNWIEFNYPSYIKPHTNELELNFYLSSILPFTSVLDDNFNFSRIFDSEFIQNIINSLLTKSKEIEEIKLSKPSKPNVNFKGSDNFARLGLQTHTINLTNQISASFSETEINQARHLAKEILNLDLPEDFFYTGNLMQNQVRINFFPYETSKPTYFGTEEEIRKKELIDVFINGLIDLSDQIIYWKKLSEFRIIPIVIRNNGSILNESVDILLHLPDTLNIVYPKDFPIPERYENLKDLSHKEGVLSNLLKHKQDSKVKEYSFQFSMTSIEAPTFQLLESLEEKKDKKIKLYNDLIKSLFDFEIYYDNDNKVTLACTIDSIKPNDSISLPCYLFIRSKEGFLIEYEINSKNLPSKIIGTIVVNGI